MGNGKVDGERLCITGGSAGGYTTLAALAFKETFKAGASLYGVSAWSYTEFQIDFGMVNDVVRSIWLLPWLLNAAHCMVPYEI